MNGGDTSSADDRTSTSDAFQMLEARAAEEVKEAATRGIDLNDKKFKHYLWSKMKLDVTIDDVKQWIVKECTADEKKGRQLLSKMLKFKYRFCQ